MYTKKCYNIVRECVSTHTHTQKHIIFYKYVCDKIKKNKTKKPRHDIIQGTSKDVLDFISVCFLLPFKLSILKSNLFCFSSEIFLKKTRFSFVICYHLEIASGTSIKVCVHFSIQLSDPCGAASCIPCACSLSLCELICALLLYI